ncbi:helix-turn-helix domain-containing protein [Tetragenococcus halophilus]|uniref:helix-turn-helix domain-containing protein n=1 Tax=Tetragenococcus halophilus TaxID=51669 RepID=UPI001B66D717|nr:helix-turn-helix domain-containing protein [Tetragenococcus halophilus]GFK28007.1 hypothetical protein YG2_04410 [Tetragenococcus halophilus]
MELDKRLKVARKNAGLSQNEVAEKLHISRQAISQWENGRSYPDLDNLTLLSQLYQVDIYELNGQNKPADPPIQINKESEKENNYKNKDKDEGLVLLIFSCILFLIAPFGVFIAPIIIWRNRVEGK